MLYHILMDGRSSRLAAKERRRSMTRSSKQSIRPEPLRGIKVRSCSSTAVTGEFALGIHTAVTRFRRADKGGIWMLDEVAEQVWNKATRVSDANEAKGFRKDQCGAWILKSAHGDRSSPWGWEIDHIIPTSQSGTNQIGNLRPLHWRNNAARQADRLVCAMTADGTRNIAA